MHADKRMTSCPSGGAHLPSGARLSRPSGGPSQELLSFQRMVARHGPCISFGPDLNRETIHESE
jgi:hypothetical protein